MAERAAKVHRNQSNRAKVQDTSDRKVVYKSVLDNPFRIQWPNAPLNIQNSVLALVISLLDGVADYQQKCQEVKRKRKRVRDSTKPHKKSKNIEGDANASSAAQERSADDAASVQETIEPVVDPPSVLRHIIVGINEATKDLESLARLHRETLPEGASNTSDTCNDSPARLVLVCREDVNPSILIGHLPHLVAACNSTRHRLNGSPPTWLVPLAKGAESSLAAAMGLRRAAVMVVKSSAPGFSNLTSLLELTPILSAPWLEKPMAEQPRMQSLVPTHIKQLRTTAPKNMKAVKEQRSRERALAKERRRAKLSTKPVKIPKRITVTS